MTILYNIIHSKNISKDILSNLLDSNMYETSYQDSHLKKLYTESLTSNREFDCVIANINGEPVAIGVIEKINQSHPVHLLESGFRSNSKMAKQLNKQFKVYGFLQLYVKPDFRSKGIAKTMAKNIEEHVVKNTPFNENELPMLIVKGYAYDIADKHLKYSYLIRDGKAYSNLNKDLHWETYKYISRVNENKENAFIHKAHLNYQIISTQPRKSIKMY